MRTLSDWANDLLVDQDSRNQGLEEALRSPDPVLRDRAAELVIGALGKAQGAPRARILHLLQAHWWPPSRVLGREAFGVSLEAVGEAPAGGPELRDTLLLWSHIARFDRGLGEEIAAALDSENPNLRHVAAGALGRLGEDGRDFIPRLAAALNDPDRGVAEAALESLSALAPLGPEAAAPALWQQAGAAVGKRKAMALSALRGLLEQLPEQGLGGGEPEERVLFEATTDADPVIRLQAVGLLGLRKAISNDSEAALKSRLEDDELDVAAASAVALLRLRRLEAEANALLKAQLCASERERQDAAIYALEPVEVETLSRARPALEAAAEAAQGVGREAAIGLLLRLGS